MMDDEKTALLFAWPTAGQRKCLVESMDGFARNLADHGRESPFLVSLDCRFEELNSGIASGIRRIAGEYSNTVSVCDYASRELFLGRLKKDFDPEICRYALMYSGELRGPGSNRNAAMLASAGNFVVFTDDDVFCLPGVRGDRIIGTGEPVFSDEPFPVGFYFYASRECLLADIRETSLDVALSHLAFLGRKSEDHSGSVLVTCPGNYGDSGFGRARTALSLKGAERMQLMSESYEKTKLSREVIRIAEQNTISHSMHLMGMQSGYDARVPLPPYFPVGGNEDGFFAMLMRTCFPDSLTVYQDFGYLHDSGETRLFSRDSLISFRPYLAEILMALSISCFPPLSESDPRERMRMLGANFIEVSSLRTVDFIQAIHETWSRGAVAYTEILENLLVQYDKQPNDWTVDVTDHLENIYTMLREPLLLFGDTGCGLTVEQVKNHVSQYGLLLSLWPDLHQAAVSHNREGTGIALPLNSVTYAGFGPS